MTFSNSTKTKHSRLRQRRAVTDIISTMMLMGVTVTGASTLTYFMNDAFVSGNLGSASTLDSSSLNLLLLSYDARDASSLLDVSNLNNQYNSLLCASSCVGTPNDIPSNGGTEFVAFQIQNNNLDTLFLHDITLNGITYDWDSDTRNKLLDTTGPLSDGEYPADGKFSILSDNAPFVQNGEIGIESGDTVNILIKLSSTAPDIGLDKGISLQIDIGSVHLLEFLLVSGDAR